MNNVEMVALGEICSPRQWPVIAKSEMSLTGFPVYGANGRIGYSERHTHDRPTILIGCRGSCGTVHLTEGKSYANGNAMALDELDVTRADVNYLLYFLRMRGFLDVTTGTSQPQIIRQNLVRIGIPLPPIAEQRCLAAVLNRAETLCSLRRLALDKLTMLAESIFLDMFGDPVCNPKGWPRKCIADIARVSTGNTPARASPENFGTSIEWIKSDNLSAGRYYAGSAVEFLSEVGRRSARTAPAGSILVTCIAGSPNSIGNVAMVDREVAFNQQINALIPIEGDPHFWYAQIVVGKRLVQLASTDGMKGMVSKSRFEQIELIAPPIDLQRQFADRRISLMKLERAHDRALDGAVALFHSLQHRAFRSEL